MLPLLRLLMRVLLRLKILLTRVIEIRVAHCRERRAGIARSAGKSAAVSAFGGSVRCCKKPRTSRVTAVVIGRAAAVKQRLKRVLLVLVRSAIWLAAYRKPDSTSSGSLRCGNAADGRSVAGSETSPRQRRVRGGGLVEKGATYHIRLRHYDVQGAG